MDPGTALTIVARIDAILQPHAAALGADLTGYRNHACRVALHCVDLVGSARALDEITVAAAFHDLAIWTDGTFDYLEPSAGLADAYLQQRAAGEVGHAARRTRDMRVEVRRMIVGHHRLTRADGLAEAFRRADWVDVSLGLLTFGLPRARIRERGREWPSAGFHRRLLALAVARLRSHPFDPLPMLRW